MAAGQQTGKRRVVFIDIARALAALLVMESHLVTAWTVRHHVSSPVFDVVNSLFTDPLYLSNQGIGQPGVPLFFLISGFIVTPLAVRQGVGRFAVGRVLRIYPTLIVVVLLTGGAMLLGLQPLLTGQADDVTPLTLLTNATLVNYLLVPQVVLIGVAWTLIIEVVFYLLIIALLPLVRRHLWAAIAVELTFVQIVLMTARSFGPNYLLFAVTVSYIPIVVMGQVIWAANSKRIPLWAAGVLMTACWVLYVWAGMRDMGRIDSSYDLSLAIALLCFLLGLFAEDRLKERAAWTWLSERTYSLYLWHGLVGYGVLSAVEPVVGFEFALVVAVIATFGAVEVSYRLIEHPSHVLARRLASRKPDEKPRDIAAEIAAEVTTRIPRVEEPTRQVAVRPRPPQPPQRMPMPQPRDQYPPRNPQARPAPRAPQLPTAPPPGRHRG
ncbi:acyltransferase family protein [Kutzneria buriramensis]|uniref:Peptidoglycan/LPS O-acetylase OafA/YrhL n=1 Tax=Kutzneria buriramensis TaxID=1045776 RepID=A0A3E0HVT3_9PSEU|nr:acyltransferase family protein [Kutzneria buriramensis]REH50075.1 peptidoglycan/LPS O-acetylase OafA/YrhL [Kutzneria buriramensis]